MNTQDELLLPYQTVNRFRGKSTPLSTFFVSMNFYDEMFFEKFLNVSKHTQYVIGGGVNLVCLLYVSLSF